MRRTWWIIAVLLLCAGLTATSQLSRHRANPGVDVRLCSAESAPYHNGVTFKLAHADLLSTDAKDTAVSPRLENARPASCGQCHRVMAMARTSELQGQPGVQAAIGANAGDETVKPMRLACAFSDR
jgi:hypothetical protein